MPLYDRFDNTLILTGRPASRSTSRETGSQFTQRGWNSAQLDTTRVDDELFHNRNPVLKSKYETVSNISSFTARPSTAEQSQAADSVTDPSNQRVEQLAKASFTMSRTRNKYRLRKRVPSQCDEMLFGKSKDYPASEDIDWKAPWDTSKPVQPCLFDSCDRAGHYTIKSDIIARRAVSANSEKPKRPWK